MRLASLLLCATLSSTCAYAAPATAPSSPSDAATLDAPFTLQRDTQIPGKTLKAGSYTIVIKDHLTDRAIIQVKNDSGKIESTFLGVFHSGLQGSGSAGPVALQTEKGPGALRGFKFPNGGTVEFVYPKAEAAAIATSSPEEVLAIDPASDNLKSKGKNLSKEDAQIVTLWSLQATKVSTGQPAIAAKKYVSSEPNTATNTTTAATAESPRPAAVAASAPTAAPVRQAAPARQQEVAVKRPAPAAVTQVASSGRRPALSALPHTASNLPYVFFVMLGSFTAAGLVRVQRQRVDAR